MGSSMRRRSNADLASRAAGFKHNVDGLDVDEMTRRREKFRAFILVVVPSTSLKLSYKVSRSA